MGLPLRGTAQARGRYRIYNTDAFKCAAINLTERVDDPTDLFAQFSSGITELGYRWTGEFRIVLKQGESPNYEIQLGIE